MSRILINRNIQLVLYLLLSSMKNTKSKFKRDKRIINSGGGLEINLSSPAVLNHTQRTLLTHKKANNKISK